MNLRSRAACRAVGFHLHVPAGSSAGAHVRAGQHHEETALRRLIDHPLAVGEVCVVRGGVVAGSGEGLVAVDVGGRIGGEQMGEEVDDEGVEASCGPVVQIFDDLLSRQLRDQ